ncbi:MAG: anaerobic ribonucleoside-triphosphate reductase activating protein [Clostridia bacterium]|nr:anaerobic ribonucleoside-triphosphate reductase activating protein [Clostridia bacterium]
MHYATIKVNDIANGTGVRVSLFVSGCTHRCKGCFNAEAWDFSYGQPFTSQTEAFILQALAPDYVAGLSLLGGEPMEPANQRALLPLLRQVKAQFPEKTVWCYTGYWLDSDLLASDGRARTEATDAFLSHIDVLVDGPFEENKKDIRLRFRGSSNQRIIDVPATLAAGKIVQKEWGDFA